MCCAQFCWCLFFFCKQKTAYEMRISDWSSDVCSSDLSVFSAIVQAPVVEEVAKGLGVFLIYLAARRSFNGPVDGIVYGALVGAGFAFTENIQYFAVSLLEGGMGEVTMTFFLRAVLSPFAHVMSTAMPGFEIGRASGRERVGKYVLIT